MLKVKNGAVSHFGQSYLSKDISAKFTMKAMFLAKDDLAKFFFFDFLEKLDSYEKSFCPNCETQTKMTIFYRERK